ncbi:MAG: RNA polymerase sigma factor [Actinomycetota bacterium]
MATRGSVRMFGQMTQKGRSGKRTATLEVLFDEHASSAIRFAYFLTSDRDLAEDVVQEAFVRVASRFGRTSQPNNFRAYLNKSILNLAKGNTRRRQREREKIQRLDRAELTSGSGEIPEKDLLWECLMALPERQRAVIFFRFYEDLSLFETARILECSTSSVKSRTYRALKSMRRVLREEDLYG